MVTVPETFRHSSDRMNEVVPVVVVLSVSVPSALKVSVPVTSSLPVMGASLQRRGGTARHDAVAWGYARAASARGVHIIQNCEVTGIKVEAGRAVGVETTRGFIGAKKVALAVAGNSSRVAAMAGLRLPIETHVLQAFVTEGVKPLIDIVMTFGLVYKKIFSMNDFGYLFWYFSGLVASRAVAARQTVRKRVSQLPPSWRIAAGEPRATVKG